MYEILGPGICGKILTISAALGGSNKPVGISLLIHDAWTGDRLEERVSLKLRNRFVHLAAGLREDGAVLFGGARKEFQCSAPTVLPKQVDSS